MNELKTETKKSASIHASNLFKWRDGWLDITSGMWSLKEVKRSFLENKGDPKVKFVTYTRKGTQLQGTLSDCVVTACLHTTFSMESGLIKIKSCISSTRTDSESQHSNQMKLMSEEEVFISFFGKYTSLLTRNC